MHIFQEGQSKNQIRWHSLRNRTRNRTKVRELKGNLSWKLHSIFYPFVLFVLFTMLCDLFYNNKKLKSPLSFCPHSLLIWHFTFPYLKELYNFKIWKVQRPFSFYRLWKCWTKVVSAMVSENLTVYLFQEENVHLSLSFISYLWANFLFLIIHFPQFYSDRIFFPISFDEELG